MGNTMRKCAAVVTLSSLGALAVGIAYGTCEVIRPGTFSPKLFVALLALFFLLIIGALTARQILAGVSDYHGEHGPVSRVNHPVAYWLNITLDLLCFAFCLFVIIRAFCSG
jgi:hypothetical protein